MEGRMIGKRGRGRPRQKVMDWLMEDGYWKLKEKAQHREEWSRWIFGPAGRQITRAHSFPRQNLTNFAANLVNSAAHRGKADEIPRLTAGTQLNFRGLIKS